MLIIILYYSISVPQKSLDQIAVHNEDSIVLKRLIQELSSDTTRISEIRDLYKKLMVPEFISKAEENSDNACHEVLRAYYFLETILIYGRT